VAHKTLAVAQKTQWHRRYIAVSQKTLEVAQKTYRSGREDTVAQKESLWHRKHIVAAQKTLAVAQRTYRSGTEDTRSGTEDTLCGTENIAASYLLVFWTIIAGTDNIVRKFTLFCGGIHYKCFWLNSTYVSWKMCDFQHLSLSRSVGFDSDILELKNP
jgi:hypothetical protein